MIKLLGAIFLLSTFLVSCGFNNDVEVIKVDANVLISEFENNYKAAIGKYKNKIIQINGKIVERASPKDRILSKDASYVVFGKTNQKGSYLFKGNTIIICYFNKVVVHDLNDGDTISVQCRFKKYYNSYKEMYSIDFNNGKIIFSEN